MKAAQYKKYGDTSAIEVIDNAKDPEYSDSQILIEVFSSSINPVESAIRNGYMQQMLPLNFPATLGGDFSGVVKEVGKNVTKFKIGDEIFGIANPFKGGSGSVAQFVTANEINSAIKPSNIDHEKASSLPLVGTSAIQALEEHIQIESGQKILIHGGAGGIGSIAIQVAKSHGAYVATTTNNESIEFIKNLGANEAIDYKTQDFTKILKEFDAVFDTVGGEITNKSIYILKKGGILVTMAGQIDDNLAKEHDIKAITQMTNGDTNTLNRLKDLIETEKIKPVIDSVFSLEQAKEAYELLEEGHTKGKIVIRIK